jgi:hypothetical protein
MVLTEVHFELHKGFDVGFVLLIQITQLFQYFSLFEWKTLGFWPTSARQPRLIGRLFIAKISSNA